MNLRMSFNSTAFLTRYQVCMYPGYVENVLNPRHQSVHPYLYVNMIPGMNMSLFRTEMTYYLILLLHRWYMLFIVHRLPSMILVHTSKSNFLKCVTCALEGVDSKGVPNGTLQQKAVAIFIHYNQVQLAVPNLCQREPVFLFTRRHNNVRLGTSLYHAVYVVITNTRYMVLGICRYVVCMCYDGRALLPSDVLAN